MGKVPLIFWPLARRSSSRTSSADGRAFQSWLWIIAAGICIYLHTLLNMCKHIHRYIISCFSFWCRIMTIYIYHAWSYSVHRSIHTYIYMCVCIYIYVYCMSLYSIKLYFILYSIYIILSYYIILYIILCYTMLCYIKFNYIIWCYIISYYIYVRTYVRTYVCMEREETKMCMQRCIYIYTYVYSYIYIIIYSVIFLRQHFPPFHPTGATFSNCSSVLRQHSQDQVPSILRCTWAISAVFFAKERTSITTLW